MVDKKPGVVYTDSGDLMTTTLCSPPNGCITEIIVSIDACLKSTHLTSIVAKAEVGVKGYVF